jgi:hypothetical protein
MVWSNPNGVFSADTTSRYKNIGFYGRLLPTYAFTSRKPTGPTDRVEIPFNFSFTHRVTLVNSGTAWCAAPVCMGFLQVDIARTLAYADLINSLDSLDDGPRWQYEFKDQSSIGSTSGGAGWARAGVFPACCYVLRPSTGSVVGWFWSAFNIDGYYGFIYNFGGVPTTDYVAVKSAFSTVEFTWGFSSAASCVEPTYLQDVVIASGDVVVVEYWAVGIFNPHSASYAITSPAHLTGIMSIGGGTDYRTPPNMEMGSILEASATYNTTMPLGENETSITLPISVPFGAAGAANLITVTPMTGPVLRLGFDNPVGITGPTITGPVDGLGVTGVTAHSTTEIDLACAIRPDHPDGDADNATLIPPIGEADPLGPPVPTGVGATVI